MEIEHEEPLPVADVELTQDLFRLFNLKQQKAVLEHEIEDLQAQLTSEFEKVTFSDGEKEYKATVVRSESFDIDLAVLEQTDPKLFSRVTKSVLDKTLFNRALTNGEIASDLANKIAIVKARKPWLSISEVKNTGENE